ncbi:MAG: DUF4367 domain-containing protein, partial [Oscillochloris sp.]|nr:DUF4367 domain-containing protein [Oscillochloris sp.]
DAAGNPISRIRAEVLESSEPELVGSLIVSDGETFWLYSPSENTVVTGNTDEMKDAVEQGPAGATAMLQDIVQQGLDAVDLEVTGSEQVAGKDTWVVKVTPKEDTSAQLQLDGVIEGMMWIDEELALPLKLTLDASDFGNGGLEVETIEVNSGLSADIFTFTPPADATIVDAADIAAEMQPRAATIEEARSSVSFTLLEPTYLPAGTALIEVRVIGTSTVILNYGGADASLSLVQSNAETGAEREPPAGSEVTPVTVRGVEGTLIIGPNGEGSLLRWEENGIRYVIAGTLSGDEALNVAEGLE